MNAACSSDDARIREIHEMRGTPGGVTRSIFT